MKISSIRSFRRVLRRFERLNQSLTGTCCRGVTMAQCHVLLEIEESPGTTIVRLANDLRLDKSTLSRTVDGLVRLSLAERKAHPTDRRFTLLELTPAGKRVCDEINRESNQTYQRAFQRIPRSRWDEIKKSLEALTEAMLKDYQASSDNRICCS